MLMDSLIANEKEQSLKKAALDDSEVWIDGLPKEIVETMILPRLIHCFTGHCGISHDSVEGLIKDLLRLGSCSKRWNHFIQNSKFNGILRLATETLADINRDLAYLNKPLLSGVHVTFLFHQLINGFPEIPICGSLPLDELSRLRSYWRGLSSDDKETLLERFSFDATRRVCLI